MESSGGKSLCGHSKIIEVLVFQVLGSNSKCVGLLICPVLQGIFQRHHSEKRHQEEQVSLAA